VGIGDRIVRHEARPQGNGVPVRTPPTRAVPDLREPAGRAATGVSWPMSLGRLRPKLPDTAATAMRPCVALCNESVTEQVSSTAPRKVRCARERREGPKTSRCLLGAGRVSKLRRRGGFSSAGTEAVRRARAVGCRRARRPRPLRTLCNGVHRGSHSNCGLAGLAARFRRASRASTMDQSASLTRGARGGPTRACDAVHGRHSSMANLRGHRSESSVRRV
jgi:hypothetical protein